MIFREKNNDGFFRGKNKGFEFTITYSNNYNAFYVVVVHLKKDIRFNSLWSDITFETFDAAKTFCETFDYKKHKCVGNYTYIL